MQLPQMQEMARAINEQAESMSELLDDLLELSRLDEMGAGALRTEMVELGSLVKRAARNLGAPGNERNIRFEIADDVPAVMADAERLRQVCVNVLSNACKYSDPQSAVTVSIFRNEGPGDPARLGIRVRDRGMGIASEEMPFIFERFWRSKRVGAAKGIGLGMSIAKNIVELHGGSIEVSSQPGTGTEVTVWIPCVQDDGEKSNLHRINSGK